MKYGKLYSSILKLDISISALRVYLLISLLLNNKKEIQISLDSLRKKLNLFGKDKISCAIKELESNKLITVKRSKINDSLNNVNTYSIKPLKNKYSLIPEQLFILNKNDLKVFALLSQKNRFMNHIDINSIMKKISLSRRAIQNSIKNLISKQIITIYELNNKSYYVINKSYTSIVDKKELLYSHIDNI